MRNGTYGLALVGRLSITYPTSFLRWRISPSSFYFFPLLSLTLSYVGRSVLKLELHGSFEILILWNHYPLLCFFFFHGRRRVFSARLSLLLFCLCRFLGRLTE
ncbi:uncharacterized protein IWZ02DRAFT_53022 [Phyllosticta citriasiana]|uniref:uncharacterized protein n=1 Tax=Phyllosticta citriasiana TaxID=595635 RepID=UPI0030FD41D8